MENKPEGMAQCAFFVHCFFVLTNNKCAEQDINVLIKPTAHINNYLTGEKFFCYSSGDKCVQIPLNF